MTKLSMTAKAVLTLAAAAGFASSANAELIKGVANLTFGRVVLSAGEIDFNPSLNPGPDGTPTYGAFRTAGDGNSGSFAHPDFGDFFAPTNGTVQDISANPADANYIPIGTHLATSKFLNFNARPNWDFSQNELVAGDFGTPFKLTENGGNVSVTMTLNGIACDMGLDAICNAGDDKTKWTGVFSAQYTNTSIAAIFATLQSGGSLENNTWSATIEAKDIPEPTSLALVGLALAGVGVATRRRASK